MNPAYMIIGNYICYSSVLLFLSGKMNYASPERVSLPVCLFTLIMTEDRLFDL